MKNLVTSKEVSEKLKNLGVRQESMFWWWVDRYGNNQDSSAHVQDHKPNNPKEGWRWCSAYLISELKDPLKPYMKNIEISARDDIFNPDFWGNYLISKLTEKGNG